jgi:hypothetical protein
VLCVPCDDSPIDWTRSSGSFTASMINHQARCNANAKRSGKMRRNAATSRHLREAEMTRFTQRSMIPSHCANTCSPAETWPLRSVLPIAAARQGRVP